jgi:hypothetical protein
VEHLKSSFIVRHLRHKARQTHDHKTLPVSLQPHICGLERRLRRAEFCPVSGLYTVVDLDMPISHMLREKVEELTASHICQAVS